MSRVRDRIGDKRVLDLVKAFLKAGILSEDGIKRDTGTGTPQGGSSHPCLPTLRSAPLTTISPRPGETLAGPQLHANSAGAEAYPPTASSAMRTIVCHERKEGSM